MLNELQKRIKGSRLYKAEKSGIERLYIRYGQNNRDVKTSAWLQVVNDRLKVGVKVENKRCETYYDDILASRYQDEIEKQFHEIIHNCELERKKIPLHERLRDNIIPVYENSLKHQADALRFLCSMKVSALFADTGTGKSKIAIDLCVSRYEAGQIKKVLVFCPVSTKENFQEQINTWCHCPGLDWKIIGTESMSSSNDTVLEALNYVGSETQIIIDESHHCKTPFAKRSKRIHACTQHTSYKLIMTGTPTENVRDMYMQYAMLSDLITGCNSYLRFEEQFLILGGVAGDEVIGYKNLDYLMGLLEPYTYQIRKEDCLNLPAKTFHTVTCSLNERQQELYEKDKEELLQIIQEEEFIPASTIFRYFTSMQQICCGYYRDRQTGEIEKLGTGKTDLLNQTKFDEGQTIIFCKYLFEVDLLTELLGSENCAIFTGRNRKERNGEKDKFTHAQKKYFVATMGSGGIGLNGLQHCSRIVFFSNSFKYTERKQCIGRIDRQGQVWEMDIWDLITNAGIDYRIQNNLARKGNLADEIREMLMDKTRLKIYVKEL